MLLAAQSMAVGTIMVRWVSKYSDPIMATGWVGSINLPITDIIFWVYLIIVYHSFNTLIVISSIITFFNV